MELEIGQEYKIEDVSDSTIRVAGYTYALNKTIIARYHHGEQEGELYDKKTEWYWELYFKLIGDE